MSELLECPSCATKIKSGAFSSNLLFGPKLTKIINEYAADKKSDYCNKCGSQILLLANNALKEDFDQVSNELNNYIRQIPVITLQAPQQWEYNILGIVTAQSVTGAGVLAEFTASFSELFGTQSGRYNAKIKGGENLSFTQLRKHAMDIGGNAIIGTDIDYAEVGGDKGMIMVCITGTAIKLNNPEIPGEKAKDIEKAAQLNKRLMYLSVLKNDANN